MAEYLIGEPVYISDSEKIYRYRVDNNIFTGDVKPISSVFINSRLSCEFNQVEFINLSLDYKPRYKGSRGLGDDFAKDNTIKAPCKIDVIIDHPEYDMVNSRFCVREVPAEASLVKRDARYYWKVDVKNYDIFDKLVEKVDNILPIMSYSELYSKEIGISLQTTTLKVKMILDYYWNLLDKERKGYLCEKVRTALNYI